MAKGPLRLGSARIDGATTVVVARGDACHPLERLSGGRAAPSDLRELIASWADWRDELGEALARTGEDDALDPNELEWLPPLMPPKLICIGANYNEHNAEMLGALEQPFPYSFLKPPSTTVRATGDTVALPGYAEKVDYEAELAVVMGDGGEVFGYTILNDLSVRDWVPGPTFLGMDWVMLKGFDGSAPFGPWITLASEVTDPQALQVRLWVNDDLRQDGSTADMVFSVREIVDHLRRLMTLEVGDVIATGTPSGVAMGMTPPPWLKAGDHIRVEIEGLGALETTIAPAGAAT